MDFVHKEYPTLDFDRNPLIPFAHSNEGPSLGVVDINKDGLEDIFICGGKKQPSKLFLQDGEGNFNAHQTDIFKEDAIKEDVDQTFADVDNDGDLDLIVVSAGNEFTNGKPLQPRLYRNANGQLKKEDGVFDGIEVNASKVEAIDFDKDGDLDLFIASNAVPTKFGLKSKQYLLQNDGNGNFEEVTTTFAPELKNLGNIKDFVWKDFC